MSLPEFNLSSVYNSSSAVDQIYSFLDSIEAQLDVREYLALKGCEKKSSNECDYKVKFIFNKKFSSNLDLRKSFNDGYNHITFDLKSRNITTYNEIVHSNLPVPAVAFFALIYFGLSVFSLFTLPVADWLGGYLDNEQKGEIRVHCCINPEHV